MVFMLKVQMIFGFFGDAVAGTGVMMVMMDNYGRGQMVDFGTTTLPFDPGSFVKIDFGANCIGSADG